MRPSAPYLAWKNLVTRRGRLAGSVVAVTMSVLLILVLVGIYRGTIRQSTTYIDHTDADLWVAQAGTDQLFGSASVIEGSVLDTIRSVEGVQAAAGIIGFPLSLTLAGEQAPALLVGYDDADGIGGPWKMVAGRKDIGPSEVIMDETFAARNGVGLGDTIPILGQDFVVVGYSGETSAIGNSNVFVTLDEARRVTQLQGRLSYILVQLSPTIAIPTAMERMVSRLGADADGVNIVEGDEFSQTTRELIVTLVGPPIQALIAIGVIVALVFVASVVRTLVVEQFGEFGVLRAVGHGMGTTALVVAVQVVIICVVGAAAALALALPLQPVLGSQLGDVTIHIDAGSVIITVGIVAAVAFVGSMLSLSPLARLEPARVFAR